MSPQPIGFKLFIVYPVIIGLQQQSLGVTMGYLRDMILFSETLQKGSYTNVFTVKPS